MKISCVLRSLKLGVALKELFEKEFEKEVILDFGKASR